MGEEHAREHVVDRSSWKPGPWDGEPDRWEDRHAGFPVLAVRNSPGNWCGYVGLPAGHPWRSSSNYYDEIDAQVHGGLTYMSRCQERGPICHVPREGESDDVVWVGFDCAHAGDLVPFSFSHYGGYRGDVYRNLDYVQNETRRLADQAAAAAR